MKILILEELKRDFLTENNAKKKEKKLVEQSMNLIMNSFFGFTNRKDTDYKLDFKTERWMETEIDDRAEECHKLENRGFNVKSRNDERNDDDKALKNL